MTIIDWIESYRKTIEHRIDRVPFSEVKKWNMHDGAVRRDDKAFFSIKVATSDHPDMPDTVIVHQPEVGILGFVMRIVDGRPEILLHAKSEPGNVNLTQIGPTVQATVSNYRKKHDGKATPYIQYFTGQDNCSTLVKIEQSEQGNRFYDKYNCNVVCLIEDLEGDRLRDKFKWSPLSEVIELINEPYLFNTDFKSVLSHMFAFMLDHENEAKTGLQQELIDSYRHTELTDITATLKRIQDRRNAKKFNSKLVGLNEIEGWDANQGKVVKDDADFNFDYFSITLYDRERIHWGQPLITKETVEKLVLVMGKVNGELVFVFKEREEIGYANYFQLGPMIQYDANDDALPKAKGKMLLSFLQSEEGGRFYQNKSVYAVYRNDDLDEYLEDPRYYILSLNQICKLLEHSGIFTNESRTMITSLIPLAISKGKLEFSNFSGNEPVVEGSKMKAHQAM